MSQIHTQYILFCLACLVVFSCGKDPQVGQATLINGFVKDAKSNLPIEGAEFNFGLYSNQNQALGGTRFATSGQDGSFNLELDAHVMISGFALSKDGYHTLARQPVFVYGERNDSVDVKMFPLDGVLRLELKNTTGLIDKVYVKVQTNTYLFVADGHQFQIPPNYAYEIPLDQSYKIDIPLCSEEYAFIYWDEVPFNAVSNATFQDSIFLTLQDTTVYSIVY